MDHIIQPYFLHSFLHLRSLSVCLRHAFLFPVLSYITEAIVLIRTEPSKGSWTWLFFLHLRQFSSYPSPSEENILTSDNFVIIKSVLPNSSQLHSPTFPTWNVTDSIYLYIVYISKITQSPWFLKKYGKGARKRTENICLQELEAW